EDVEIGDPAAPVAAPFDLREASGSQGLAQQLEVVHVSVPVMGAPILREEVVEEPRAITLQVETNGDAQVRNANPNDPAWTQNPETFVKQPLAFARAEMLEEMRGIDEVGASIGHRDAVCQIVVNEAAHPQILLVLSEIRIRRSSGKPICHLLNPRGPASD